jgi:hypothetical protein
MSVFGQITADTFGYKHWTLEDPPRCFYVGKGVSGRAESRKSRNHKWHAIVKRYGLRVEICLGPVTNELACAWEIENIIKESTFSVNHSHDDLNDIGCNLTNGGDGVRGYVLTDAQREASRQINREIANRPEVREAKSRKSKGVPKPIGFSEKLAKPMTSERKQRHLLAVTTEGFRIAAGARSKERWALLTPQERAEQASHSAETLRQRMIDDHEFASTVRADRLAAAALRSKPVQQLQSDRVVAEYASVSEAHHVTGIWNINAVCLGRRALAGGFAWRFRP